MDGSRDWTRRCTVAEEGAQRAASFTAVGVSKDGTWEPIEVTRLAGTGISYRPGQLPAIAAGVPQYRIKGAFIARF